MIQHFRTLYREGGALPSSDYECSLGLVSYKTSACAAAGWVHEI